MSESVLLWIVTALYVGQGVVSAWHGNMPYAVVFGGYALANVGLIIGMKG